MIWIVTTFLFFLKMKLWEKKRLGRSHHGAKGVKWTWRHNLNEVWNCGGSICQTCEILLQTGYASHLSSGAVLNPREPEVFDRFKTCLTEFMRFPLRLLFPVSLTSSSWFTTGFNIWTMIRLHRSVQLNGPGKVLLVDSYVLFSRDHFTSQKN